MSTVDEIAASPKGPKVAAFFDLDGTVIFGYSAQAFAQERMRRREIGPEELFRLGRVAIAGAMGRAGFVELFTTSSAALAGHRDEEMVELGEHLFTKKISDRIFPEARDLVAAHRARGHTVVMISSATRYQVDPVARALGIDHVVCNSLESHDGVLTGAVTTPVIWGETKASRAQEFASAHKITLARSYFYADGDEDVALMRLVGQPRPTNPGRRLEAEAKRSEWPILRFDSRGKVGMVGKARNAVGISSLGPAAAGGLIVGAVTRRRRVGVDFFIKSWVDALFASCGVSFDVQGEENLWKKRPAVFIFNHRNNIDVVMTAKLVEREFTGVGKKEAANNPLGAALGKMLDAVFIDRSDSGSAVDALKPVEDAMARGLSVIISPEGTRSVTREVGAFKKGPFRIAMAARAPIVPVIFRNADEIAPRSSMTLRPGIVHVVVGEPIPTIDWTVDELPERIAEVRQVYVDTLAHWPEKDA